MSPLTILTKVRPEASKSIDHSMSPPIHVKLVTPSSQWENLLSQEMESRSSADIKVEIHGSVLREDVLDEGWVLGKDCHVLDRYDASLE